MNLRPFQIGVLAVFGVAGLLALFFLSNYQSPASEEAIKYGSEVVIWGTLDRNVFDSVLSQLVIADRSLSVVKYVEKDPRSIDNELVNAIAEGQSPDLVLLPADKLVFHRSKLLAIPYTSFPVRDFKNMFIDASDVFLLSDGVYAFPLLMDPLVMYWNRDLYASNGLVQPAQTWETMVATVVPTLTKRDSRRTILQSAIAFGEYRNVQNAKPVLLTLLLQSGSALVTESAGRYTVGINTPLASDIRRPLDATLQFYTDFSNVNSPLYSWNRAQSNDTNAFIAGDLATYFGFGSEAKRVTERNPNLNFDVAVVPQGSGVTVRRTYATVYGLSIPQASKNRQGAYAIAQLFSSPQIAQQFADKFGLTPAHRTVLARTDLDAFQRVNYESALFARSWLDPEPEVSSEIFSIMVDDVVSSRARVAEAAEDASQRLQLNFR
jgi:ABC-type glycerol-3-phosphate transport system substrate-binding protein